MNSNDNHIIMSNITKKYSLIGNSDYRYFGYENEMYDFIKNNANSTQIGISFSNVTTSFIPNQNVYTYTLYYNSTFF
jgi:hypothetical protein